MNKKVLSAILFGALMAGTGTFTSCIDNEEPASIATLRGAKAELLKAKAAVENAKVAQVQAEAEVARAQAALIQAQAAAEAAKAESDKALAAAQIAEAQAKAEQALALAEKARLEAEAAYQKSIMELKKAQAELVGKQAEAIADVVKDYEEAIGVYNKAVDAQTDAERALAKHISVMEEKEANKALLTRGLTLKATLAEKAYAGEQAALEAAEKAYAEAQTLEPNQYADKLSDVKAELEKIRLEVIDLNVTAAETLVDLWGDKCVTDMDALVEENAKLTTEEIYTLPALEIDLAGGIYRKKLISFEEETVAYSNILDRCTTLEAEIEELENAYRDENDNAWTKEFVVVLKEELKKKQAEVAEVKKAWEEAVAAYNTNEYKDADEKAISGYDDVVAALTAFNTAQAAVNTAKEALIALDTEEADANACNETMAENKKVHDTAWTAAQKAWTDAMDPKALKAEYDKQLKPYTDAVTAANNKVTTAKGELKQAEEALEKAEKESTNADEITAARNLVAQKTKAVTDAETAATNAVAAETTAKTGLEEKIKTQINTTRQTAFDKAYAEWQAADKKALDAFNAKWGRPEGTAVLAIAAQEEVVAEKVEAAAEANKELREAAETYNENAGYRAIHVRSLRSLLRGEYDEEKGYAVREAATPIEDILVLNKDAMMKVVIRLSSELYGNSYGKKFDMYHGFEARLVAITAEEIEAMIEEEHAEATEFTAVDYIQHCEEYGVMGEEMALVEKIRVAEFWLTNTKYIDESIAALKKADDALHAIKDEAEEAINKNSEEIAALFETHIQEIADALAPIQAKLAEVKPLQALKAAYFIALSELSLAGEENLTQADIDAFIKDLKQDVIDAEKAVYAAETKMLWAREILAQWNRGDIEYKAILEAELEDANTAVERAADAVERTQNRLNAAIEALKWTAAE